MSDMYFDLFTRENSKAYEYGDLMSPVPRFPETLLTTGSDTVYYASLKHMGIWQFDGSAWTQIHTSNPTAMAAGAAVLYAVFSTGLYKYENGAWTLITSKTVTSLSAQGTIMHYYVGAVGDGIYAYDETTDTSSLMSGTYFAGDPVPVLGTITSGLFAGWSSGPWSGLWLYNGSWSFSSPTTLTLHLWTKGDVMFGDFGSAAIYRYESGSWALATVYPSSVGTWYGNNFVLSYANGLFQWVSGTDWTQIAPDDFPYPIAGTATTGLR